MKKMIVTVALAMVSIGASAQTSTATAVTTTAATAKVKKAKKKVKKDEKANSANVAPATTDSAAVTTATTAPAAAVAPAAATSTATAPAAGPTKKWGVSLVNDISTDYAGGKEMKNAIIENAGYLGASYKITATEKAGVRQYYMHSYDPNNAKNLEGSDIKQSFTAATISTKIESIFGSDAFSPTLIYFFPGHTAEVNNYGKDLDGFMGQLRGDAWVNWTLNPRWSVSYYGSLRQTLGAKETFTTESGDPGSFEATSRMLNIGYVNYTINDSVSLYYNAGLDSRMSTEKQTSTKDDFVSSVGSTLGFLDGKLTFYTDVGVTTSLKSKGVAEANPELYKKENIAYTLTTIIAL